MTRCVTYLCLVLAIVAVAPKKTENSMKFGERIIQGAAADISSIPYQAALLYKNEYVCGGSIISAKYILTAGHCFVKGSASDFSVRVGSNFYEAGGELIKGKKITKHPKYKPDNADNDSALLELSKPISLNSKAQPIPLADSEPKKGDAVLVSGWGATRKGGSASKTLQSVVLQTIDRKTCKTAYKNFSKVTDNMFCAGDRPGGKDTGKGDSGGPAVVNGKLAGIVSWGLDNSPGVYTVVAKIKTWIEQTAK